MPFDAASAPWPSFGSIYHQTSYPSISPTRPELSCRGKSVIVTGGSAGIGARTVLSFAEAGASHIAIIARREHRLKEIQATVAPKFPATKVHLFSASITDEQAISQALSDFSSATGGKIDVLVSNAAKGGFNDLIANAKVDEWMAYTDANLRGTFIVAQQFLKHAREDAVMINIASLASFLPLSSRVSAYAASKAATVSLYRDIQLELDEQKKGIRCISVQPGGVSTEMSPKSGPMVDDASLCGDFCVWLASKEAWFTKGKYLFANWDVDELKNRSEEIAKAGVLEMWIAGLERKGQLLR